MSALGTKLRSGEGGYVMFWCPGCDGAHALQVGTGPGPRWEFNGDGDKPTFSPSVLSNGDLSCPGVPRCHSFVKDGMIQFLSDCTHELAGQTVPLPDFDAP